MTEPKEEKKPEIVPSGDAESQSALHKFVAKNLDLLIGIVAILVGTFALLAPDLPDYTDDPQEPGLLSKLFPFIFIFAGALALAKYFSSRSEKNSSYQS